jgi:hypothetical protein
MPTAGTYVRAADVNDPIAAMQASVPFGLIDYVVQGSDQLVANTTGEHNSTAIAVNVGASRLIEISLRCTLSSSLAGDTISLWFEESGAPISPDTLQATFETNDGKIPGFFNCILEGPSAGIHTYTTVLSRPFGLGTGGFLAGALLKVTDLGPVP